jgi:hypothetical protein
MILDPLPAVVLRLFMRRPAGGVKARNPLAIIFGPTEDAVLHSAPCDVLAVRVLHSGSPPAIDGRQGHSPPPMLSLR